MRYGFTLAILTVCFGLAATRLLALDDAQPQNEPGTRTVPLFDEQGNVIGGQAVETDGAPKDVEAPPLNATLHLRPGDIVKIPHEGPAPVVADPE